MNHTNDIFNSTFFSAHKVTKQIRLNTTTTAKKIAQYVHCNFKCTLIGVKEI